VAAGREAAMALSRAAIRRVGLIDMVGAVEEPLMGCPYFISRM
jgi:hypothetical protein